ncbi:MAG: ABC transporter permease [Clostridiales bacterium]|nr:ABC transporter permease [Clostridiales bacterium]
MVRYIVKRTLLIIPAVLVILFILYALIYFLPASRMTMMPISRGGDTLDAFFTAINAPDNFLTKFVRYIYNIIIYQDFGRSTATRAGLISDISYRIRNTLFLLLSGVGVTMITGIPIGIYAALHKGRAGDRVVSAISLFLSAIPPYSIAIILSLVICVYLRLLPIIESYTNPKAYILPAVTIALGGIASVARMARSSMLEVLEQPYITALRSKGLGERSVIYKHALKNALLPIISTLGGFIAQLLCGTLVVEHFFNVPGLGGFMLTSLSFRDHFEILGCAVILTIILMCMNLASDILYAFVNPRIRLRYAVRLAGSVRVRDRNEAGE